LFLVFKIKRGENLFIKAGEKLWEFFNKIGEKLWEFFNKIGEKWLAFFFKLERRKGGDFEQN